jgi:hypothetical protein
VADDPRRSEPDVLPAITLDVEPTDAGLRRLSAQLAAFGRDHDLPDSVGARLVSVAGDVTDLLLAAVTSPFGGRLQVDADIGISDAQLIVIAEDHRLADRYRSLRERLEAIGSRCDSFAVELAARSELQVWARFLRFGA